MERSRGWTTGPVTTASRHRAGLVTALAVAMAWAAAPAPLAAQEPDEEECRCVDARGEEIENCHCFRTIEPRVATSWSLASPGRARIGVMVRSDADDAQDLEGVILREITPGSPADEAGLRSGDRVVRVGGTSVLEPLPDEEERFAGDARAVDRFIALVGELEPGEEAEVEYVRDGRTLTATVVPEEGAWSRLFRVGPREVHIERVEPDVRAFFEQRDFPFHREGDEEGTRGFLFRRNDGEGDARVWSFGDGGEGIRLLTSGFDPCFRTADGGPSVIVSTDRCVDGVHMQELNPQLAEYFDADRGVLVTEVADESSLGLRAGDVILSIGERSVEEPSDVRRVLASYESDEPVVITVVRKGEEMQLRGTRR